MILVDPAGNLNAPKLAPGSSITYNLDGSISAKAVFNINKSLAYHHVAHTALPNTIPQMGDQHPKEPLARLCEITVVYDEVKAQYICTYLGVWATTIQSVDGIAQTSQEPIVSHKNWSSMSPYGVFSDEGEFLYFPAAAPNNLGGVQSYLAGGLTVRTRYTTTADSYILASLSLIGKAFTMVQAGLVRYSASYRLMLCTSVTYQETNVGGTGIWVISEEYTRTDSPGWNALIYPNT